MKNKFFSEKASDDTRKECENYMQLEDIDDFIFKDEEFKVSER